MEQLSVAQRKMERIMLGITLRDHKRNTWTTSDMCTLYHRRYQDGNTWMGGGDTLPDSKTPDGQNERQSGHHENGQDGREDLKQDGGTALSSTLVTRGQE